MPLLLQAAGCPQLSELLSHIRYYLLRQRHWLLHVEAGYFDCQSPLVRFTRASLLVADLVQHAMQAPLLDGGNVLTHGKASPASAISYTSDACGLSFVPTAGELIGTGCGFCGATILALDAVSDREVCTLFNSTIRS